MIICYVCPAIFYIRLGTQESKPLKWGAWILLIVGIIAGITSAVVTIQDYMNTLTPTPSPFHHSTSFYNPTL